MERITMSIEERLAREFDALIAQRGYASRSEAMRDLLRRELEASRVEQDANAYCVANLSYVYNHHERDLAERLAEAQHAQHELVIATMHVHLDHEHCLETLVLKGPVAAVRELADRLKAERGVRHGQIHVITVDTGDEHHKAPGCHHHHHHGRLHLIPKS